jgi:hypothetical protein
MAGRVRLAVTGIQDQWLTGEPQFSYFVMNYRRHTRFATEAVETPFDGNTCRIPNNVGDLVRSMMLKMTLSPSETVREASAGTRIIEHADLMIGGQIIERINGEYIYMYDQIHNNNDDVDQTLYFLTGHGYPSRFSTFYVNLPFYFFRHPSLAIPMCAIRKQLVEVRVTFTQGTVVSSSLITDFYFITDDEKHFLLTRPIEYVITQLQMTTVPTPSVLLKFQHPVKELFFVASNFKKIRRIALEFNGTTVFDQDGTYLAYEQSLRHHTGCPYPEFEFYMYSFALRPEVYYPTGQVNMSRIVTKKLTLDVVDDAPVNVYALNYNVLRVESGLAGLKF